MNPKYPIYIISKGRPTCLTARILTGMGVPFKIIIEPQQYSEYLENWNENQILVLPFSDLGQGSIPVRNWVLHHSRCIGHKRHWILDDNIEGFDRLNNNLKLSVSDGTIFKCAEVFTDRYSNIMLSGFNYSSFCKATDKVPPFYLNTRIYSCILVNNSIPYKWRGKFNEDTDLSLRVLRDGFCTVLFNAFLAGKVTTMRMKGGNTEDVYGDTDNRREFAESLVDQHPEYVKVTKKFGRWHHQVNYKPFKKNKLIRVDDKIYKGVDNYGMKLTDINKINQPELF